MANRKDKTQDSQTKLSELPCNLDSLLQCFNTSNISSLNVSDAGHGVSWNHYFQKYLGVSIDQHESSKTRHVTFNQDGNDLVWS